MQRFHMDATTWAAQPPMKQWCIEIKSLILKLAWSFQISFKFSYALWQEVERNWDCAKQKTRSLPEASSDDESGVHFMSLGDLMLNAGFGNGCKAIRKGLHSKVKSDCI